MKTTTTLRNSHLLWLVAVAFLVTGATRASADHYGSPYHDHDGFWDGHRHYHPYTYYQHHHGYWDERNGIRIWINI